MVAASAKCAAGRGRAGFATGPGRAPGATVDRLSGKKSVADSMPRRREEVVLIGLAVAMGVVLLVALTMTRSGRDAPPPPDVTTLDDVCARCRGRHDSDDEKLQRIKLTR